MILDKAIQPCNSAVLPLWGKPEMARLLEICSMIFYFALYSKKMKLAGMRWSEAPAQNLLSL